jgi:hypothetical protein
MWSMITFVRTAEIAPGKYAEAIHFAKALAEFVNTKYGANLSVGVPVGGSPNRIAWFSTYASLAELEETANKFFGDPEYVAKVAAAEINFIAVSLHNEIWRDI